MIIRKAERTTQRAVRFGGKGEVAMTPILPSDPAAFFNKGRLFSDVELAPGQTFGDHDHHGEFEVLYILSGEGVCNNNGVREPVSAGDVCICNDGEEHGMENTGTEPLRYIALILNTK